MKRGPLNRPLSPLCCLDYLNSVSLTSLHLGFRNCFMLDPFCSNALIIFFFPDHLNCRIYNTKFLTHISFLFSIFYLSYHFNFSFQAHDLPFIHDGSHLIMLSISHWLQEKKHRGQLYAQSELPLLLSCSRPGIYVATCKHWGLALSWMRRW
jgi:hypothetical protein